MPATATRNPIIPAPSESRLVNGALHVMSSVDLDNVTVVFHFDTLTATFALADRSLGVSAYELNKAIRAEIPGRTVFRGRLQEGGSLDSYFTPTVDGSAADIDAVLEGIKHLFDATRKGDMERSTLRSVYRFLVKRQSA